MSKPFTNPFFEADMSKMFDMSKMMDMSKAMGGTDMSKMFDMSKMMDMPKMFDMSKMMGDYKTPLFDMEVISALHRKNMDAYAAMSQASYESMQALWRRQADSFRQVIEEMTDTWQAVMACPTPEAKAIKQAEVSKVAMDKYIANLRDASETLAKCNSQAMETVGARLNDSLTEMYGMVKNVAACAA
jgi:phasin family protein